LKGLLLNTTLKPNKKSAKFIFSWLVFAALCACTGDPELPDLSTIEWIGRYGYETQEIFLVVTSPKIPGPRIKVTVGSENRYLLIDPNSSDLLIRENAFRNANFEPQRMSNQLTETNELMVEEGYLHEVAFLNFEFPIVYAAMIKQSSRPFLVSGIIGRNLLDDGRLTIDMRHKILAYSSQPAVALENPAADSNLVAFTLKRGLSAQDGLLKFQCRINGNRYLATLSTRHAKTRISPEIAQAISSKTPRNSVTINSLKIGSREFRELKCEINNDIMTLEPENAEVISVIIGMDVINQSLLTIDFSNQLILLE